jgi:monofunctional glycosyltransferase
MLGQNRPQKQKRPPKPPAFILTPQSPERLRRRARRLQRDLDYELSRLRGHKRLGLLWLSLGALFVGLVVTPFLWVASLRDAGPAGSPAMMSAASGALQITRVPLPLDQIDPLLVQAALTQVDPGFCADGSALRQRVAYEAFLWRPPAGQRPSAAQRAFARYLGGYMEVLWPQRRVVEVYLNTVVWGRGQIGVEAAALTRYGLSARNLEPRLQALPLAIALTQPALLQEGAAAPGALADAVDTLAANVQSLAEQGAFSCLMEQPPAP